MRTLISRMVFAIFCLFIVGTPAYALESIEHFDVRAKLNQDRSATIEERITYDFGVSDRHGIYRLIPDVYNRNGGNYKLHLDIQGVQLDGRDVPYKVQRKNRDVEIKIGDPDRYLTGKHTYVIQYATNRSLNDIEGNVEWYWNLTGNGWPVPIKHVSLELVAPSSTRRACFVGVVGSQDPKCAWKDTADSVQASSTRSLNSREGMTVAFEFPATAFVTLSTWDRLSRYGRDNGWVGLPLVAFLLMWFVWYHYGKEPKGRGTIVPHYEEPRSLPPGLQVALRDQHLSSRAITATILDLARRGYLTIEWQEEKQGGSFLEKVARWTKENKFVFVREKPTTAGGMHDFEKIIFKGLFDESDLVVDPSDLRSTFYKDIEKAREAAFKELKSLGWFPGNPSTTRALWITGGVVVAVVLILASDQLPIQVASSIMCGLIVGAFGWHMPRMTKEAAVVVEEVEGFRWFLSVTEEKRLQFTDAPAKKPEQFARFLPAAVAFGIEKEWAHQFDGMTMSPPTYLHGSSMHGLTALQISQLTNAIHDTNSSSMYSAPSSAGSGGSGFSGGGSGGGMGGGGGGSW